MPVRSEGTELSARIEAPFRPGPARLIVAGLMIAHSGLLVYSIHRNFVTIDEVGHIASGVSHWQTGTFWAYRVNPPLPRMLAAVPVLVARPTSDYHRLRTGPGIRSEWDIGQDFLAANKERYFDLVCLARLSGIVWSLLGAWIIYLWCRDLYGRAAGCLGVALWCFEPNILAFGQLIVPDVPASVAGLGATYVFWRTQRRPSTTGTIASGLLLGVAQLTKFTLLVLYLVWPMLEVLYRWSGSAEDREKHRFATGWVRRWLGIVALSLLVINLGYGFKDSGRRLGDCDFVSSLIGGEPSNRTAPDYGVTTRNQFTKGWLANLILPVPTDYLMGIDAQRRDFESGLPSYLAGQWRHKGWWYYYVYALAVKVPSGLLALFLWNFVMIILRHASCRRPADEWSILLPAAIILVFVSSQTGFNHHMRYVLPVFPFAIVSTSKLAYFVRLRRWPLGLILLGLLCWSAMSAARVYPHQLSYFNELAGGPERGHEHLLDSNIDWGQDLLYLKQWLDRHPEARPLGLAYFNAVNPAVLGVDFRLPPSAPPGVFIDDQQFMSQFGPRPGYYALSVNFLRGIPSFAPPRAREDTLVPHYYNYEYFRQLCPIGRIGYSLYLYRLDLDEANAVRIRMGLPTIDRWPEG